MKVLIGLLVVFISGCTWETRPEYYSISKRLPCGCGNTILDDPDIQKFTIKRTIYYCLKKTKEKQYPKFCKSDGEYLFITHNVARNTLEKRLNEKCYTLEFKGSEPSYKSVDLYYKCVSK